MYKLYKVGNRYEDFKGMSEGISVRFNSNGLDVLITFYNPNDKEVSSIKNNKLEIRATYLNNLPYMLFKFDELNIMDCAMVIEEDTKQYIAKIEEGIGYALNILFVDTSTGEIKAIRTKGLETEFSKWINETINKSPCQTKTEKIKSLNLIWESSSDELWSKADVINKV